jgi:hypothetical protein
MQELDQLFNGNAFLFNQSLYHRVSPVTEGTRSYLYNHGLCTGRLILQCCSSCKKMIDKF